MKAPQKPSLSAKVLMVIIAMGLIIVLLLLASCNSLQTVEGTKLEPVIENKIREINSSQTMTPQEKESTISLLESLRLENKALREVVADRDQAISRQGKLIGELQREIADQTQNAGKYEGIRNLVIWLFGAVILWLLLKVFKSRIPFNIPGI